MDGHVTSAAAADGNLRPDSTPVTHEGRQGAFGGRTVAQPPGGEPGVPVREPLATGRTPPGAVPRIEERASSAVATSSAVAESASITRTPGSPNAEGSVSPTAGIDPVRRSSPPWLQWDRHAQVQAAHIRLVEICSRLQDAKHRADLLYAVAIVKDAEDNIGWAHELLESTRTQALGVVERRKLSVLLRETKLQMTTRLQMLNLALYELVAANALAPEDAALAQGLLGRLDDVYDYLRSCGPAWGDRAHQVEATLPIGAGKRVAVDCHILAGKALRTHLGKGLPPRGAGSASCGERYFHAPDLALSGLSNTSGRLLYAGASYSFYHAHELDGERVAGLSNEALQSVLSHYHRRLVKLLYASNPVPASEMPSAGYLPWNGQEQCERIRKMSADDLVSWARSLKLQARVSSYEETVFAAVLSDENRTSLLLPRQDTGINLFSIALLTPGDVEAWSFQSDCYRHAEPVEFLVAEGGSYASSTLKKIDVSIRQCALMVEPERPSLDGYPSIGTRESERLLGPLNSPSLGGDARAWLTSAESSIAKTLDELAGHEQFRDRASADLGANHPLALSVGRELAREKNELQNLEKQVRTFADATRQLKTLWAEAGDWTAGNSRHRMAAARLALIGFLMGETPLLSCASGRDFIAPVEEELRFIATFADSQAGHLPPLNLPADLSGEARRAFALP